MQQHSANIAPPPQAGLSAEAAKAGTSMQTGAPGTSPSASQSKSPGANDAAAAPFAHARTNTKLLWTISAHSLETDGAGAIAARFANYGLDAARVTFTQDAAPLLRKLRTALTSEMERRGTHSAAEGWCPFVMSHTGRRAHLFVPGGTRNVVAGESIELVLRADSKACMGDPRQFKGSVPEIVVTSEDMLTSLAVGSRLIISYEQTEFSINALEKTAGGLHVRATVVDEAILLSGMDVHSPHIPRNMFPLTDEDQVAFASRFDDLADYVILAGLRTAAELAEVKAVLFGGITKGTSKRHPTVTIKDDIRQRTAPVLPRVLLKVDSREALELLPSIMDDVDGIVLSRSELGLSVPAHELPIVQKKLIAECNHRAKLVIVASELMYSMRVNPNPTRAEVSDMANAAADGADALFLAEEVTEGPYAELVAAVSKETLANSEHMHQSNWHRVAFEIANDDDAVAYGALKVAEHHKVRAIVCLTEGGYTALRLSSLRTPADIIAVTYNYNVMRQLSLLRSVTVLTLDAAPAFDQVLEETKKLLARYCDFGRGDRFVFVSLTASPISARNSNVFTLQEVD